MFRSTFLAMAALAVSLAFAADAAAFTPRSRNVATSGVPAVRAREIRCEYPRARQSDGRSLWDLGNRMGQWPTTR